LLVNALAICVGWVWDFATNSNHLMSASWDTTVKIWDKFSDFKYVTEFKYVSIFCYKLKIVEAIKYFGTYILF